MPDGSKDENDSSFWGSFVGAAAKTVGVLGATAVATAFLFDCVYFWRLDRRLLSFLVLSDHIETAVRYLLQIFVISSATFAAGCAAALFIEKFRIRTPRLMMLVAMAVAAMVAAYYVTEEFNRLQRASGLTLWEPVVFGVYLVVLYAFVLWGRIALGTSALLKIDYALLPVLWVLATILMAYTAADLTLRQANEVKGHEDVVIGPDEKDARRGLIVRFIDKGIILASPTREFTFVPKEKIRRVCFRANADPNPKSLSTDECTLPPDQSRTATPG